MNKKLIVFLYLILLLGCTNDTEVEETSFSLVLNASPSEGGIITPSGGDYKNCEMVRLEGIPNLGYTFKEWIGSVQSNSNPLEISMNSDKNIIGVFVKSDVDNDGVIDESDLCDDTPQGEEVDANGCSIYQIDTDEDGIIDVLDKCPESPQGVVVDENGCHNWEKTFGPSEFVYGNSVEQASDGGFIIIATKGNYATSTYDFYLLKTEGNGSPQWESTFGGSGNDIPYSVKQTSEGGYIIVGSTTSFGNGSDDLYLVKTNQFGYKEWEQTYGSVGSEIGYSIQQTSDGGFIISGSTTSYGNGEQDIYLLRTDNNGITLWEKTFGGAGSDVGNNVQITSDEGFIISGWTTSLTNGGTDVYLLKIDSNGNLMWEKNFGGNENDLGYSVKQTDDNGYIITGISTSIGNGGEDVYLLKTDSNGNSIWEKAIGKIGSDGGLSIQRTFDGGYVITGYTDSVGNGSSDVYLLKIDGNGNTIWEKTFGEAGYDFGNSVKQTSEGGYIITGMKQSMEDFNFNIYLIKTE